MNPGTLQREEGNSLTTKISFTNLQIQLSTKCIY